MARVTRIIHEDAAWIASQLGAKLSALEGATVLVTGASGFVGSYLLDVLADWNLGRQRPARLLALDNHLVGLPERIAHLAGRPDLVLVTHDLRQPFLPGEPVHYILHAAGVASPPFYRRFPLETIDVNVQGTRNLLELCRTAETRAMLHLSTSEIYGDPTADAIPTREDYRGLVSCTGPRACYDESKRLSETLCVVYQQQHGVPVKVARPFNVFGPGQRLDDGRIVPDLMRAVLGKQPLLLLSDGLATRTFCYLRDAAWAMLLVLLEGQTGVPYNLGNDEQEISIRQLAETLREVAQSGPPIEFGASRDPQYLADNPQRRCPDLTQLRALGYAPKVPLREGLLRTLASYRESAS